MKKIVSLLMAVSLCAFALAGCGGGSETASYNLDDIVATVEKANPVRNSRDVDDNFIQMDKLLTPEHIEEYAGKVSSDQSNSALIVAIKAVEGKASAVEEELTAYKTSISTGGLYAEFADKEAMAADARIIAKGDYLVMVVANTEGADYTEIDTALDEALK